MDKIASVSLAACSCHTSQSVNVSSPILSVSPVSEENNADITDLPCATASSSSATAEISLLPVVTATEAIPSAAVSPSTLETIEIEVCA